MGFFGIFLLAAQIVVGPSSSSGGSSSIVGGTCTNQVVTSIATDGTPTCTTLTSAYVNSSVLTNGVSITAPLFTSSGSGLSVANVGTNSCGTTAATIAGGSNSFEVTVGATSGTQCRITFPTAAPNRWNCVANNSTTANLARATPVDTTHVDFLGTFVGGDVVSGTCIPR